MFIYFYGIQSWLLIRAISLVDFLINLEIMMDNFSLGVVQFPESDVSMLRLRHDWSGFNRALSSCFSRSVHSFVLGIVQLCYHLYPWNHDDSSLRANHLCARDFRLSKRHSGILCFFRILRVLLVLQDDATCSFETLGNEHSVTEHSILGNPVSQTIGVTWGGGVKGRQMPLQYFFYLRIVFWLLSW